MKDTYFDSVKAEQQKAMRRKAQAKYNEKNTTFIGLRFNNKSDSDIVEQLTRVPSKLTYIRGLIREDIKVNGYAPSVDTSKPVKTTTPDLPPVEPMKTVTAAEIEAREKAEALKLLGL